MAQARGEVAEARDMTRTAALVVGVVFLLVGIAGFIPGVTQHYDTLEAAGVDSDAKLLGIFEVSVLHNLVHLAFGVAGIAMSRTARMAKQFLIGGGVLYLIVWLYGMAIDKNSDANFLPVNAADNWLHLGLGVGMLALGVMLSANETESRDAGAGRTRPRTS